MIAFYSWRHFLIGVFCMEKNILHYFKDKSPSLIWLCKIVMLHFYCQSVVLSSYLEDQWINENVPFVHTYNIVLPPIYVGMYAVNIWWEDSCSFFILTRSDISRVMMYSWTFMIECWLPSSGHAHHFHTYLFSTASSDLLLQHSLEIFNNYEAKYLSTKNCILASFEPDNKSLFTQEIWLLQIYRWK